MEEKLRLVADGKATKDWIVIFDDLQRPRQTIQKMFIILVIAENGEDFKGLGVFVNYAIRK